MARWVVYRLRNDDPSRRNWVAIERGDNGFGQFHTWREAVDYALYYYADEEVRR